MTLGGIVARLRRFTLNPTGVAMWTRKGYSTKKIYLTRHLSTINYKSNNYEYRLYSKGLGLGDCQDQFIIYKDNYKDMIPRNFSRNSSTFTGTSKGSILSNHIMINRNFGISSGLNYSTVNEDNASIIPDNIISGNESQLGNATANSDSKNESNDNGNGNGNGNSMNDDNEIIKTLVIDKLNYFDTYDVYSNLLKSGFTAKQSDLIIEILQKNLSFVLRNCNDINVHKTTWENEAYLVQAAESELRSEIQLQRQVQEASMRTDLALLEREYQLLHNEVEDSLDRLKKETEMDVNDQQSSTKLEQKAMNIRIQEVNNKITNKINSGIRTDIEALRWHSTSRGFLSIVIAVASMVLVVSWDSKASKKQPPPSPPSLPPSLPVRDISLGRIDVSSTAMLEEKLN